MFLPIQLQPATRVAKHGWATEPRLFHVFAPKKLRVPTQRCSEGATRLWPPCRPPCHGTGEHLPTCTCSRGMHKLRPALAPWMFTAGLAMPISTKSGSMKILGPHFAWLSLHLPATLIFQSKVLHLGLTNLVLWQVMAHRCVHCLWLLKLHSDGRPCVSHLLSVACPTRVRR